MQEDDEQIEKYLFDMVYAGEILAKCPKCLIPLNFDELNDCSCNSCGPINQGDIIFVSRIHHPTC